MIKVKCGQFIISYKTLQQIILKRYCNEDKLESLADKFKATIKEIRQTQIQQKLSNFTIVHSRSCKKKIISERSTL